MRVVYSGLLVLVSVSLLVTAGCSPSKQIVSSPQEARSDRAHELERSTPPPESIAPDEAEPESIVRAEAPAPSAAETEASPTSPEAERAGDPSERDGDDDALGSDPAPQDTTPHSNVASDSPPADCRTLPSVGNRDRLSPEARERFNATLPASGSKRPLARRQFEILVGLPNEEAVAFISGCPGLAIDFWFPGGDTATTIIVSAKSFRALTRPAHSAHVIAVQNFHPPILDPDGG